MKQPIANDFGNQFFNEQSAILDRPNWLGPPVRATVMDDSTGIGMEAPQLPPLIMGADGTIGHANQWDSPGIFGTRLDEKPDPNRIYDMTGDDITIYDMTGDTVSPRPMPKPPNRIYDMTGDTVDWRDGSIFTTWFDPGSGSTTTHNPANPNQSIIGTQPFTVPAVDSNFDAVGRITTLLDLFQNRFSNQLPINNGVQTGQPAETIVIPPTTAPSESGNSQLLLILAVLGIAATIGAVVYIRRKK